jgi:hypothetical protein
LGNLLGRGYWMFNASKQVMVSDTIASQCVGHDHSRHIVQSPQRSLEKPLCSVGLAPRLDKDIQHNAILIDCTSEIMLHAPDPDEPLVEGPPISGPWPTTS